jgi:chromate transporter
MNTNPNVDFATALKVHLKIGLLSFGGPAGQIALMQQEIVEQRRWVTAQSFDRGLSFAMMLPGPEAQQLATYLGWRLHGVAGGLAAGLAFILPGGWPGWRRPRAMCRWWRRSSPGSSRWSSPWCWRRC